MDKFKYNFFYKTTNLINSKFYYGVHRTSNINDIYFGSGKLIKDALKKYGNKNFKREILLYFNTFEECLDYEAKIVDQTLVDDDMCYNLKLGGWGCGRKHSEETKAKMRLAIANMSEEKRAKQKHFGPMSESTKINIGLGNKGKVRSEEAKEKLRIINTGKKHTEETKKKLAYISSHISDETRKKISDKAKLITEETKKIISEKLKGRYMSPETRKKISDGIKLYHKNKKDL